MRGANFFLLFSLSIFWFMVGVLFMLVLLVSHFQRFLLEDIDTVFVEFDESDETDNSDDSACSGTYSGSSACSSEGEGWFGAWGGAISEDFVGNPADIENERGRREYIKPEEET